MKADILSIGDELLMGQTLNTNAHWIAQQLTLHGVTVRHMTALSDDADDIRKSLERSLAAADIVLITGGLGPTSDDITRDVLNDFFGAELVMDEGVLQTIEHMFVYRGRHLTEEIRDLARVPDKAMVVPNSMGTAPGMLFHENGKVVVSMPGVPYEMKAMMEQTVLPWLKEHMNLPAIVYRTILTAGKGETQLAEKLRDFEAALSAGGTVRLAYLPDIGKVKLRVTAKGNDVAVLRTEVDQATDLILKAVGNDVYGFDTDSLEASIGRDLVRLGKMLGTAESCTGGNIARTIVSVAGSSAWFSGSIVSYSNQVKMDLLGVQRSDLEAHGAVSEPVVKQMIKGATSALGCDLAVAVSGIAGPDGGSEEKPVGTVFIGVGSAENQWVKRFQFTTDRMKNIEITSVVALVMLRKFIGDAFAQDLKKE